MARSKQGNQGNQNGKPGKPAKETHPHRAMSVTVHLDKRTDKDLIDALNAYAVGERAPIVKMALRARLDQNGNLPAASSASAVARSVNEIREDVEWMKLFMHDTLPQYFINLVEWMRANPGAVPSIAPAPAQDDTQTRISDDKVRKREGGIKKW